MYQICQGKIFLKKPAISPNCGSFQYFLALFDIFTTRYDHPHIKFEFSGYFYPYKHFLKMIFEIDSKMPFRPLCNGWVNFSGHLFRVNSSGHF